VVTCVPILDDAFPALATLYRYTSVGEVLDGLRPALPVGINPWSVSAQDRGLRTRALGVSVAQTRSTNICAQRVPAIRNGWRHFVHPWHGGKSCALWNARQCRGNRRQTAYNELRLEVTKARLAIKCAPYMISFIRTFH